MNEREAEALTGLTDPFAACRQILQWVDMVILTLGPGGMVLAGWTDEEAKRQTREPLKSASIPDYNEWEFSRLIRRHHARDRIMCFTHVHPYKGGPDQLINTNGAGDAALAAVLHDLAANRYHFQTVPDSDKHRGNLPFLTYSSLSRNAQYGNRVAYEVLRRHSPRLDSAVPPDEEA
ncbi:MAG: inosine kinase [Myxococcota bacterium]|jgi:inosine kinase